MANSADPDQLAGCISKGLTYPGSTGIGLNMFLFFSLENQAYHEQTVHMKCQALFSLGTYSFDRFFKS